MDYYSYYQTLLKSLVNQMNNLKNQPILIAYQIEEVNNSIVYVLASPSLGGPNMTVYSLWRKIKSSLIPSMLNSADVHQLGYVSYEI